MRTLLDFVLDERLGEGSNAIVHRARRMPGGETVALKCPLHDNATSSADLDREARLLGRLRHPNVVRLLEVVRLSDTDPTVALALELIDGPTLDALRATTAIEPARLALLGADVARGLEALHDVGIVHGDVKPTNVLVRASGQAVLVDLDAAVGEAQDQVVPTSIRATARFAAPEVLEHGARTTASDIWSLGASLLACAHRADELPVDLRDLLDACLATDPAARPNLTRVIDGLDRAAASHAGSTATSPTSVVPLDHDQPASAPDPDPAGLGAGAATTAPGPVADPTVTWRPTRARLADLPRPPHRPTPARPSTSRGRIGLTVAGVALGLIGTLALFSWASDALHGSRPSLAAAAADDSLPALGVSEPQSQDTAAPAAAPTTTTTTTTPPSSARPVCSPGEVPSESANPDASAESGESASAVQHLQADLLGEGCVRGVSWDPVSAQATVAWPAGVRRYALGQPGDQLVLGDWDADGKATPALYRPATGDTFTFSGWAEPDAPLPSAEVQATGTRNGRAVARTAVAGTADQLIVEEAGR